MGMQLPGELVTVLGFLGVDWPEGDEEKIFKGGNTWINFATRLQHVSGNALTAADKVSTGHKGPTVEAFQKMWEKYGGNKNLDIAAAAGTGFSVGLFVYAAVVLVLKINAMIQLVILAIQIAQAIATAAVTFGASLLEIPIFRQIAKTIIENLIWMAIGEIIG
ncbi:hypothetical protein [Actinopolymorpha pittospori]|uniref:Outer membrane channel protein CpnT-like N-terminal domain-containing protein n=1 Tax=Actinopolymorpha pittospori TaxID=648752 RepID=A0A927MPD9_9ACTN|nr:hypothetical protein [Actinopolymorpha pittospori]MBE1604239.1 hypothetical protein [Actinopolymorpha pittospori]